MISDSSSFLNINYPLMMTGSLFLEDTFICSIDANVSSMMKNNEES